MTQIGTPQTSQTLEIAAMVGRFEEPLVRYATRILGDRERARDVVQDTFVRLCQADQGSIDRPREWLFRVCRNRAIDLQRRDRRVCGLDHVPEALTGVPSTVEQQATAGEIRQLFERLPDSQRKVMSLRFEQGESYRTIGARTGLATGTVGHLIHKGVRMLRSQLGVAVVVLLAAGTGAAWWQTRPAPQARVGCAHAVERVSLSAILTETVLEHERARTGPAGERIAGDGTADGHATGDLAVGDDAASKHAAGEHAAGARAARTRVGDHAQEARVESARVGVASAKPHATSTSISPARAHHGPAGPPAGVPRAPQASPAPQAQDAESPDAVSPETVARSAKSAAPPAVTPPKGPEPPPKRTRHRAPTLMFELE